MMRQPPVLSELNQPDPAALPTHRGTATASQGEPVKSHGLWEIAQYNLQSS